MGPGPRTRSHMPSRLKCESILCNSLLQDVMVVYMPEQTLIRPMVGCVGRPSQVLSPCQVCICMLTSNGHFRGHGLSTVHGHPLLWTRKGAMDQIKREVQGACVVKTFNGRPFHANMGKP